jgi:membrane fusion protein, heavy metal efflux system
MRGLRYALAAAGALALFGCGKPHEARAPAALRIAGDTVSFAPGSPQLAEIVSAPAELRRDRLMRFSGRLAWDEDRTVRVFAPFGGRVLEVREHAGDAVRAGQVLALIASPEVGQAQADAARAEQDHALALRNLERVKELAEHEVASQKELDAARADAARSAAEQERAAARLKVYGAAAQSVDGRLALRSPIDGVVVERHLNPGQELRPDAAPPEGLFVISDPAHLWFTLDVSEADAAALRKGAEVRLSPSATGGEPVVGRITYVSDMVDPQTRTVKARGELENPERRLRAEMYVTAELKVPAAAHPAVPAKAVFLHGERDYVFVDAGGGKFERRGVVLGDAHAGEQEITQGLAAGEKVVTDGSLLLEKLLEDAK